MAFVKFPKGSLIPKWLRTLAGSCAGADVGFGQRRASGRVKLEYWFRGLVFIRQRKVLKFDFG